MQVVSIRWALWLVVFTACVSSSVHVTSAQIPKRNIKKPVAKKPAAPIHEAEPDFRWEDRIGVIGQSDEIGEMKPGKTALVIHNGRPVFVSIDQLKPFAGSTETVLGFKSTRRALTPVETARLQKGFLVPYKSGLLDEDQSWITIIANDDTQTTAKYIRVTGDTLFYLKPSDTVITEVVNQHDEFDDQTPTREMPLEMVRQINAPNDKDVLPSESLIHDATQHTFEHRSFIKREPFAKTGNADGAHGRIRFMDTETLYPWKAYGNRGEAGVRADGFVIQEVHPDGSVVYVGKVFVENAIKYTGIFMTQKHKCCPGLVRMIVLDDESTFVFDPSQMAFIHEPSSKLPLTYASLDRLTAERLAAYQQLVAKHLVPQSVPRVAFTDLSPDDRVDFMNRSQKDIQALDEMRELEDYRAAGSPVGFRAKGTRVQPKAGADDLWVHLSSKSVSEQIESAGKPPWIYFRQLFIRASEKQALPTWSTLTPDEQMVVHRYVELEMREYARMQANSKERDRKFTQALAMFGAGLFVAATVAQEQQEKSMADAINRTYALGDDVRSMNSKILGGWSGRIAEVVNDKQYRIKIESAHPDSNYAPGKTYDFFKGDFRP